MDQFIEHLKNIEISQILKKSDLIYKVQDEFRIAGIIHKLVSVQICNKINLLALKISTRIRKMIKSIMKLIIQKKITRFNRKREKHHLQKSKMIILRMNPLRLPHSHKINKMRKIMKLKIKEKMMKIVIKLLMK